MSSEDWLKSSSRKRSRQNDHEDGTETTEPNSHSKELPVKVETEPITRPDQQQQQQQQPHPPHPPPAETGHTNPNPNPKATQQPPPHQPPPPPPQPQWRGQPQPPYPGQSQLYPPPMHGHPPPGHAYPPGHGPPPSGQPAQFWGPPPMGYPGPPMGYPPHYQAHPGYPPPPYSQQPPHHMAPPPYYQDQPHPPHPSGFGEVMQGGDPMHGNARPPNVPPSGDSSVSSTRTGSQISKDVSDRRQRKNAQSRARAAKLRDRITQLLKKPVEGLNSDEKELLKNYEDRRQRKNDRSRERAIEKKSEMERLLAKPERKRNRNEKDFLEISLKAKQRKNEGDRLRRQRIKHYGVKAGRGLPSGSSQSMTSSSVPAGRGSASHHPSSFTTGMPDIPMSPLPTTGLPHTGAFGSQSPGQFTSIPNIRFPSPPTARGDPASTGVLETPGGTQLSHVPVFQGTTYPSSTVEESPEAKSQLHLPQASSRVEQRRHPDGSMTISIGGAGGGGGPYASEQGQEPEIHETNLTDVSHLLLYPNEEDADVARNGPARRNDPEEDDKTEV